MNSNKRIINVVGDMGGLKTTKSSTCWDVLKDEKEEKDSFRRSEESSFANRHQQLLYSASGNNHYNRKEKAILIT